MGARHGRRRGGRRDGEGVDHLVVGDLAMGVVVPTGAHGGYREDLVLPASSVVRAPAGADADEDLVRRLGADVVVRRGDDAAGRIREHFPDGVDGLADGAVATVRGYRGDGQRGLRVEPAMVRRVAEGRGAPDRLRQQVQHGALTLRVAREVPAEEAAAAHRLLEGGGVRGRLVLTF